MNAAQSNTFVPNIPDSKAFAPNMRPDCTDELAAALRQRIMVIDGAMGTAIQRDRPDEAGYRGERFMEWPTALQGKRFLLRQWRRRMEANRPRQKQWTNEQRPTTNEET